MADFTISQAVDGSYITITDKRTISVSYLIQVQSSYMDTTSEVEIDLSAEQIAELDTGLDLEPSDFGYSDTTWVDGIFTFNVTPDGGTEETLVKAFMELSAAQVFKNSLNYRLYLDQKEKSTIQEQVRLLNNMSYSAEIGSTTYFAENLQLLEDLL